VRLGRLRSDLVVAFQAEPGTADVSFGVALFPSNLVAGAQSPRHRGMGISAEEGGLRRGVRLVAVEAGEPLAGIRVLHVMSAAVWQVAQRFVALLPEEPRVRRSVRIVAGEAVALRDRRVDVRFLLKPAASSWHLLHVASGPPSRTSAG